MKSPVMVNQNRNQMPMEDVSPSMLKNAIETVCEHVETLSRNQEHLANAQNKIADMMERQVNAIERILDHLNISPEYEPVLSDNTESQTAPETDTQKTDNITENSSSAELLGRDEVLTIIKTMRKNKSTFDQVAKQLNDLKQPTFSGRGVWHAQTIHRICNKK